MTLDEARCEARRRWKSITPFRLGVVAGETGSMFDCPYAANGPDNGRARRHFVRGILFGIEQRKKTAAV